MNESILYALKEEVRRFRALAMLETEPTLQDGWIQKADLFEQAAKIVRDSRTDS